MCPVCIANVMVTAAGATSAGGLAVFAIKNFFFQPDRNHQTNETKRMKIETLESKTDESEVNPRVVSQAQWLVARKDLLTREKEVTRLRDAVGRNRRGLPWAKVEQG